MANPVFIKVGNDYINPAQVRMVKVTKLDVEIYFNAIPGCRTVSHGDADLLLTFIKTQHI